eukprot:gene1792-4787_t
MVGAVRRRALAQEHRGATLNHKNPMQLVLSGNPTYPRQGLHSIATR